MNKPNIDMQNAIKVAKRIAITVVVCIPFLLAFAYLTRNVITSNGLQIFCFFIILAVVVLIEELITRAVIKRKKSKPEIEQDKTDVFR